jgi:hypothetical protein
MSRFGVRVGRTAPARNGAQASAEIAGSFHQEQLTSLCLEKTFRFSVQPWPFAPFRPMQVEEALLYAARSRTFVSPVPR